MRSGHNKLVLVRKPSGGRDEEPPYDPVGSKKRRRSVLFLPLQSVKTKVKCGLPLSPAFEHAKSFEKEVFASLVELLERA